MNSRNCSMKPCTAILFIAKNRPSMCLHVFLSMLVSQEIASNVSNLFLHLYDMEVWYASYL